MKNISEILKGLGIELTDEQLKNVVKEVGENYKTINDYDNQKKKLETAEENVKSVQTAFDNFKKDFDGVDVKELKGKVDSLQSTLDTTKQDYENKIARMNLDSVIQEIATSKNCIDLELAKTQIDYEAIMGSKQQKEDIGKFFDDLKTAKPILFKEEKDPNQGKKRNFFPPNNPKGGEGSTLDLRSALAEKYDQN